MMAMVFTLAGTLTSCDGDYFYNEDDYVYDNLIGTWSGRLSTYYQAANWSEGEYVTYITFYANGEGYEVDYDDYYGYRYESSFLWTVDRGTIYIQYDNRAYFRNVYITEYELGNHYFDGYMYYNNPAKESSFRFTRTYDYYGGYYSRTVKAVEGESDSIAKNP